MHLRFYGHIYGCLNSIGYDTATVTANHQTNILYRVDTILTGEKSPWGRSLVVFPCS